MRYRIKAPNASVYEDLLALLEGRVRLFVASRKRNLLSTGELPPDFRDEIIARGGEITEDIPYDLDLPAAPR